MAVKEKIRIRLQSYDVQLIDAAAEKIVETAKRTGAGSPAPSPCPPIARWSPFCVLPTSTRTAVEQFESRTHKRLIDILKPSNKTVEL